MAAVRVKATVTNPSSALTDFSLIIDLSDMPSSWWAAVDTTDGTRGRVYKGDGTTRLAADWIDFDDTAETGLLRVKWAGTLATTGTQEVVVESPVAVNATVAAVDTYGSDNAYDANWEGYWPFVADFDDRTANAAHGSAYNSSFSAGGESGLVGGSTLIPSDDWIELPGSVINKPAGTVIGFGNHVSSGANRYPFASRTAAYTDRIYFRMPNTNDIQYSFSDFDNFTTITGGAVIGSWDNWAMSWDSASARGFYDGSFVQEVSATLAVGTPIVNIGGAINDAEYQSANLYVQHWSIHSTQRSDAWIAYEYDQINDDTTFWGTWTVDSGTTDALTAADLTLAAPVLDSPAIGQVHALTATELTATGAALDSPALGQEHALSATALDFAPAVLDTPTLSTEGEHALTVSDFTLASPALDTPGLGQVHAFTAADLTLAAAALDDPTLSTDDIDDLTAGTMTLSAAVLDSPTMGQVHTVTAVAITGSSALLDSPTLGQAHALATADLLLAVAVLDEPVLWNGSEVYRETRELAVTWATETEISTSWATASEIATTWEE